MKIFHKAKNVWDITWKSNHFKALQGHEQDVAHEKASCLEQYIAGISIKEPIVKADGSTK